MALAGTGVRFQTYRPDLLRIGPFSPADHYASRARRARIRMAPAADELSFADKQSFADMLSFAGAA